MTLSPRPAQPFRETQTAKYSELRRRRLSDGCVGDDVACLVSQADVPGWSGVSPVAEAQGGCLMANARASLDRAKPRAVLQLRASQAD